MGGSSSTSTSVTRYEQRPLTEEEKDLLRAQADLSRDLAEYSRTSAERSQEQYDLWKQYYLPLEQRFIGEVDKVNQQLWEPDKDLLERIRTSAAGASQRGLKSATDRLSQAFAARGLTGSGVEAKALTNLNQASQQAYLGAMNDAFWQALQQSNVIRQQQLQNLGSAVNVGRAGFTGSLEYQGLAGNQASQAIGGYGSAFSGWDSTWKTVTESYSKSTGPSPVWELAGTATGYWLGSLGKKKPTG